MIGSYDATPEELAPYQAKYLEYQNALQVKNYALSDVLRVELANAGFMPPSFRRWSPVFETPACRSARLEARTENKS